MTTRRAFLKSSSLSLVAMGLASSAPAFLRRAALAASGPASGRPVLVTIFQRGAMDGLMAVAPLDQERRLKALRPSLFVPAARSGDAVRMIDLGAAGAATFDAGTSFGLHPAFEPLLPAWREGTLGIVHAVGSPDPTRSHFDAQDYMETGTPGHKGTSSGWLNRVVGELGHEGTPLRAVSLTSALPRSFYGTQPAIAVASLDDFRLAGDGAGAAVPGSTGVAGFEALYAQTSNRMLRDVGAEAFEAMRAVLDLDRAVRPASGVEYPRSPLGTSLRQIAMLIRSQVGLEVAFAESGGWDTHVRQGGAAGTFAQRARDLAQSIAAFWSDLGELRSRVVVLTMTEFGRTVRENGSGGTDHGHGSCLFVLGEDVHGGRVHGAFPGLDEEHLYEGRDLQVATDFREVFTAVARRHLGVEAGAELFPEWRGFGIPDLFRP